MGRIARYKNFYEDGIFDDENEEQEEDIEPDDDAPISGPSKVDDKIRVKKMQMLHTLMVTWGIDSYNMIAYLQRFELRPEKKSKN